MTPECSRVMDCLGEALPPDLAAHVASCAECRVLTGGFDLLLGAAPPPTTEKKTAAPDPDDEATLPGWETARRFAREEVAEHPKATPWWRELLGLLGVYALVLVLGLALLGRGGWVGNAAPPGVVAGVGLLILALMGGGAFIALSPSRRHVPVAGVLLFALATGAVLLLAGSGQQTRPTLTGIFGCLGAELALTVVPLAATLVLLCRTAFQPVRALAAGLSAGAVSLLVLHLHCADGTMAHLMWSHVVPWLALAVTAVLLRSRLRTRSHAP